MVANKDFNLLEKNDHVTFHSGNLDLSDIGGHVSRTGRQSTKREAEIKEQEYERPAETSIL
ncbi:unnamed protein product [Nippostrongylus brasiliensis]|uniref:Uncharacterized protein n=1 Tax=Nippostrongylus brasiliensis TaxID=27835 RepID=A0A0N4XTT6_NIPBR|nr:unnamed protein product [Nippostrongylus brasiliensis]